MELKQMELKQHDVRARPLAWLQDELDGYRFFDVRLARRLHGACPEFCV